jgi:hypothetical protein
MGARGSQQDKRALDSVRGRTEDAQEREEEVTPRRTGEDEQTDLDPQHTTLCAVGGHEGEGEQRPDVAPRMDAKGREEERGQVRRRARARGGAEKRKKREHGRVCLRGGEGVLERRRASARTNVARSSASAAPGVAWSTASWCTCRARACATYRCTASRSNSARTAAARAKAGQRAGDDAWRDGCTGGLGSRLGVRRRMPVASRARAATDAAESAARYAGTARGSRHSLLDCEQTGHARDEEKSRTGRGCGWRDGRRPSPSWGCHETMRKPRRRLKPSRDRRQHRKLAACSA